MKLKLNNKFSAGNSFFVMIVQYFFSDLFAVHEYKVPLCLSHSLERQTMDFHIYFVALFELEAGYFKWCSSSENCFIHCRKRCVHVGKQLDFCSTRQLRLVKTSSRLVLKNIFFVYLGIQTTIVYFCFLNCEVIVFSFTLLGMAQLFTNHVSMFLLSKIQRPLNAVDAQVITSKTVSFPIPKFIY